MPLYIDLYRFRGLMLLMPGRRGQLDNDDHAFSFMHFLDVSAPRLGADNDCIQRGCTPARDGLPATPGDQHPPPRAGLDTSCALPLREA